MKRPTSLEIRTRVLRIAAKKAGKEPHTVGIYFLLRRSSAGAKGLGLDSQALDELAPTFNGWLKQYQQRVATKEINDPDKVLTVSHLADVIEGKIKAAYTKRLADVVKKAVASWAQISGIDPQSITADTPLHLGPDSLDRLRESINEVLTRYDLLRAITTDEMAVLRTARELFQQIENELNYSEKFDP